MKFNEIGRTNEKDEVDSSIRHPLFLALCKLPMYYAISSMYYYY